FLFFFSSRRRHTRFSRDWSSDVCSSDLPLPVSPGMIEYGFAAYVSSDAPALGARPVVPYATRRRMDGMMCAIGSQNDSSEITYEMPACGRKNGSASSPKEENWSTRAPSCTYRRSQ